MSFIKPTRSLWAIVDCNSFYCSCERLFRPDLRNRPVVVLSNNDGCMISVSSEAKKLGLRIGAPLHEVKDIIRRHRVQVFSSNYQLYGDLSRRVMRILDELHPDVLQYSIDEAFLDLSHLPVGSEESWVQEVRDKVTRETGIPVTIGVASTKTLAKVANQVAKKNHQKTLALLNQKELDWVLENTLVEDVWGIGRGIAARLNWIGIKTAYELAQFSNPQLIRSSLGVVGERICEELKGLSCIHPGEMSSKKMISSTRSFGKKVQSLEELNEAVSSYIGFACEKLRAQKSVAKGLSVMLRTNPFDMNQKFERSDAQIILSFYTDNTFIFTEEALRLVKSLYQKNVGYKKAGVFLFDIAAQNEHQLDLFTTPTNEKPKLMQTMDEINQKWGRGTIKTAACGTKQDWRMLCERRSQKTQLSWTDLVEVSSE